MGGLSRRAAILGMVALGVFLLSDAANARTRHRVVHVHRHHLVRTIPPRFVFPTPGDAYESVNSAAYDTTGPIGDLGITGPTTADPYQRPAVGYDITNHYGPGFVYPD